MDVNNFFHFFIDFWCPFCIRFNKLYFIQSITWRLSLVVEFLLWVQEVASSILAVAHLFRPLGLVV